MERNSTNSRGKTAEKARAKLSKTKFRECSKILIGKKCSLKMKRKVYKS